MARYFIRVELHGIGADYGALHELMHTLGCERTMTGASGSTIKLPTGMYTGASDFDEETIRDRLGEMIAEAGISPAKQAWVLVVKCDGEHWALWGEEA